MKRLQFFLFAHHPHDQLSINQRFTNLLNLRRPLHYSFRPPTIALSFHHSSFIILPVACFIVGSRDIVSNHSNNTLNRMSRGIRIRRTETKEGDGTVQAISDTTAKMGAAT